MNREDIIDIFNAAIRAVDPYRAIKEKMSIVEKQIVISGETLYNQEDYYRLIVVGAGKATARMAMAVEEIFEDMIDDSIIIVKYDHTIPLKKTVQIEASHPLPDMAGVNGTERIIEALNGADEKTLVICLLSGGASSLLVSPAGGITIDDKIEVTGLLLRAGATIDELNAVRKHVSNVKGGRFAEIAYPATLVTLILSDVIGNRLDVIASGPTVPDSATFQDAMRVLERYALVEKVPGSVLRHLQKGLRGEIKETPKGGESFFKKTRSIIIGDIEHALTVARDHALLKRFEPEIITSELQGKAKDAANYLAGRAIESRNSLGPEDKPRCLISGGETTVTVKGRGVGGRNQELALAFATRIEGIKGITMLSAGTDGTDGPTDAAGAVVDGETIELSKTIGLDPAFYIENNDSYNFFRKLDSLSEVKHHLLTGPTGTNVMDMQLILTEGRETG